MYVPFHQLPPHSRVWVYQLNRVLNPQEEAELNQRLLAFVTEWSSHGHGLQASYDLREHHFLLLATNEEVATASGCSIDASVAFLRQLEQEFSVSFFDRTTLAFWQDEQVQTVPLAQMKKEVAAGNVQEESLYFDTLVQNVGALQDQWPKPAKDTWLARYF